ncbi:ABC transporter ATP-binding protein [Thalassotalea agarivorans]|uniref:ABC transporter ATP-binding protein n=1 Tax=Thalassotalea agarivorans TaxID=349064 RepID=UPI000B82028C|nr:ATP-binding cassette domain-containing protein [Thalassotalea agarivorans]
MTANSETILKVNALTKSFQLPDHQLTLLKPTSFDVNKGETVAIVGASGSGKTTLLSLLAGLDLPTTGEVYLKEHPLHQSDEEERTAIRAKHVGFIFQQFLLVNSLTALENVMLPAELANMEDASEKAKALLSQVSLGERFDHYPSQLSGGEQQRVAIARAFITQPEILFADEPTGNLDTNTGEHVTELLFELNKQHGTTLVLVTHDMKLAQRCERQLKMEAGQLVEVTGA